MKEISRILVVYFPVSLGVIVGFINQKIYALYAGPQNFPAIGDFQNYFQLFTLISSAGLGVGTVKLIAQHQNDPVRQQQVTANALFITGISTALAMLIMPVLFYCGYLRNIGFTAFTFLLGCTIPIALGQLGFGLLNGYHQLKTYNLFQVLLHLLNLGCTFFLAINFGVPGIMISMCLPMALVAILLIPYQARRKQLYFSVKLLNGEIIKKLLRFSLTSAVIVLLLPLSSVIIRDALEKNWTDTDTGYWQSCMNLSRFLISFITALLPVYFLPRISRNMHHGNIAKELKTVLALFATFMSVYLVTVIFFGWVVIDILFTQAFKGAQPFLVYTAIGDTFRILAIPFSMVLLSRERFGQYLFIETGYYLLVTFLTLFTLKNSMYNVYYSYIAASCLYLLVLVTLYLYGRSKKQ